MIDLKSLEWLAGMWEGIHGQGIYHEEWQIVNSSEMLGKAYLIKKGEILNMEILKLHIAGGNIFYTAEVSHNKSPVSFRLISDQNNIFIFENPEHDFPQKITYEKKEDGSLYAVVEAMMNDKLKKIEYSLKSIS